MIDRHAAVMSRTDPGAGSAGARSRSSAPRPGPSVGHPAVHHAGAVDAVHPLDHLPHDGAADVEPCPPCSTIAMTTYRGSYAGTMAANHDVSWNGGRWAVPVLPAIGILDRGTRRTRKPPFPRLRHRGQGVADVVELRLRVRSERLLQRPLIVCDVSPSGFSMRSTTCGRQSLPPLARAE